MYYTYIHTHTLIGDRMKIKTDIGASCLEGVTGINQKKMSTKNKKIQRANAIKMNTWHMSL